MGVVQSMCQPLYLALREFKQVLCCLMSSNVLFIASFFLKSSELLTQSSEELIFVSIVCQKQLYEVD